MCSQLLLVNLVTRRITQGIDMRVDDMSEMRAENLGRMKIKDRISSKLLF